MDRNTAGRTFLVTVLFNTLFHPTTREQSTESTPCMTAHSIWGHRLHESTACMRSHSVWKHTLYESTPCITAHLYDSITCTSGFQEWETLRWSADKSLARNNSRYHRTESIVPLTRRVRSCAELQVFSCYRGRKDACQATRAISTTWRHELPFFFFFFFFFLFFFFFPLQGKAPKESHAILKETLREHAPS